MTYYVKKDSLKGKNIKTKLEMDISASLYEMRIKLKERKENRKVN